MAAITITVSAAQTNRVLDAITTKYGYQATINGIQNPQTKAEFVRQWIIKIVKDSVKEHEANTAAAAAATTASNDVEASIIIT